MGRAEALEAELEVVRLEEELAAAKDTKKGPDRDLKLDLREARQAYRAARDGLEVVTDDRGRKVAQ